VIDLYEIGRRVTQTYPKLKPNRSPTPPYTAGQACCSYVLFNDDQSVYKEYLEARCHDRVKYHIGAFTRVVTSFPKSGPIDLAYLKMLCSGPFNQISDKVTLVYDESQVFIHITDANLIPSQLLYNFLIATRTPLEHSHFYFKNWYKMARRGIDPCLAFILSTHILDTSNSDPDKWVFKGLKGDWHHFWMDANSNWLNVICGKADFNPRARCVPCNSIWGEATSAIIGRLTGKTIGYIQDHMFIGHYLPKPDFPAYRGRTYDRD